MDEELSCWRNTPGCLSSFQFINTHRVHQQTQCLLQNCKKCFQVFVGVQWFQIQFCLFFAIWLPLLFWTNISTPSELMTPKITVIWILWSSCSFRFFRTISHNSQFDSSTEGSISNFRFEIAHSAFGFRLIQYDQFYGGEKQEDPSECLMMLI